MISHFGGVGVVYHVTWCLNQSISDGQNGSAVTCKMPGPVSIVLLFSPRRVFYGFDFAMGVNGGEEAGGWPTVQC